MGWNYRVMRHVSQHSEDSGMHEWFAIHEVYYRSDDVNDREVTSAETGYTVDAIGPTADTIDDLRWRLEHMLAALDKPVLEYKPR